VLSKPQVSNSVSLPDTSLHCEITDAGL